MHIRITTNRDLFATDTTDGSPDIRWLFELSSTVSLWIFVIKRELKWDPVKAAQVTKIYLFYTSGCQSW
jgi:hypothetical protein